VGTPANNKDDVFLEEYRFGDVEDVEFWFLFFEHLSASKSIRFGIRE
jgi:hypothetical protein